MHGNIIGHPGIVAGTYRSNGFARLDHPFGNRLRKTPVWIVAFTPSSNLAMGEYPKSIAALEDQGDLEYIATRLYGGTDPTSLARVRHGNAVMVVTRPYGAGGGEVVTIGSTDWVFGYDAPTDAAVVQVTRNILARPARRRAERGA